MSAKVITLHPFLKLPGVPDSARPLLARLLAEPLLPVKTLSRCVQTYRLVVEAAAARNGRADAALANTIANALLAVLARIDGRTELVEYEIIQAAVRYFVIESDGFGHDLEHEDGLFGDACVVNAMLRWVGKDDLTIVLPTSAAERRRRSAELRRVASTMPQRAAV